LSIKIYKVQIPRFFINAYFKVLPHFQRERRWVVEAQGQAAELKKNRNDFRVRLVLLWNDAIF
jgi:hypothetical protein